MNKAMQQVTALNAATRDFVVVLIGVVLTWAAIERSEICTEFFRWVADNPDYEVDSFIIAFILSTIGTVVFAWRRYAEMKTAVVAKSAAELYARNLAYHDHLTELQNRRALVDRLDQLTSARQGQERFALTTIDLNGFKAVNDLHGHVAGDDLLKRVAATLSASLTNGETVYRLGGDEFAILSQHSATTQDALHATIEYVIKAISEPLVIGNFVHHIGASAGTAYFPGNATDTMALIRASDIAMYKAKADKNGNHKTYTEEMDIELRNRMSLEQEIRDGIGAGEFVPHYQPIVRLPGGEIQGFELLARWQRKDGKYIGPSEFIPIAQECGMVGAIMLSILDQACREAMNWPKPLPISINLSPVQFKDPWVSQKMLAVLAKHGFPPRRLSVEVTESAIFADEENAVRTINSLRNQGVGVALDDFGTGYSSLHHLRTLPFDKLKIDRSFVLSLLENEDSAIIVNSIIGLASNLGICVVAEGIESTEVADKLAAAGCAEGQGYYFGRPCDAATTLRLLHARTEYAAAETVSSNDLNTGDAVHLERQAG